MDLRQVKPIHLRCPECGHDFSYNTNHVEEEIDRLRCEITAIKSQMAQYKAEHPQWKRDVRYKRMQAAQEAKIAQLQKYKKARKATAVEINLQTGIIFRKLVEQKLGKEETLRLQKEAEEQMVYYEYDTARQNFTRFENA